MEKTGRCQLACRLNNQAAATTTLKRTLKRDRTCVSDLCTEYHWLHATTYHAERNIQPSADTNSKLLHNCEDLKERAHLGYRLLTNAYSSRTLFAKSQYVKSSHHDERRI
ncbi:uncharacterized protein TrAFT101_006310 [Trichoderma asperellum]|uniref:uncharacterized protein n=1 Tax=Trichoderma asperellum TaxID=101201 RepID=UPI0033282DCB|nr:hypothetical protein TrAFT101_006310 [Trichoderma asperellum]